MPLDRKRLLGYVEKNQLILNQLILEVTDINKYLGILFSASGTFSYCQNDLYKND